MATWRFRIVIKHVIIGPTQVSDSGPFGLPILYQSSQGSVIVVVIFVRSLVLVCFLLVGLVAP